jgi:predicted nucleotidyltransferase
MDKIKIQVPREQLVDFCRKNRIKKLAFFGSVLRDDFSPKSDVDVLVEFEEGKTPGFAFFGLQEELSRILGYRVDLNTPGFLSKHFRDQVIREALVEYVAA